MDCIFCKILSGEIPSKKVYEDDTVCAFYDVEPQAPVHVLIIPKEIKDEVLEKALVKAAGEKKVRKAIEGGMSATQAFAEFGIL